MHATGQYYNQAPIYQTLTDPTTSEPVNSHLMPQFRLTIRCCRQLSRPGRRDAASSSSNLTRPSGCCSRWRLGRVARQ